MDELLKNMIEETPDINIDTGLSYDLEKKITTSTNM